MFKKDFIDRQFEEFGKVLALIVGYKRAREWEKFHEEIVAAAQKFTSSEIELLEKLNLYDFESETIVNSTLKPEQRKIIADLLFEKLSFYLSVNDIEKINNLKAKCLKFYQHLQNNLTENEFNLDVHYKLSFLNKID